MNDLSNAFHELAQRDERAFAHAPRDAGAIADARKARHRTRAVQATGGTFAIGALAVGGIQLLPGSDAGLSAASSPSASSSAEASATAVPAADEGDGSADSLAGPTETVTYDTRWFGEGGNVTLGQLMEQFQCGADAPAPTDGPAKLTIDSVDIRAEDFVVDYQPYIDGTETGEVPVVDDAGNTQWAMIADTTVTGTGGDPLYADFPSTMALLVKDGEIVATMGAYQLDPREPMAMIPAPDSAPEWEQDQAIAELGATPVLNGEPASFTTGYSGWGCPEGFGDTLGEFPTQIYPPLSDYVEAGEYELYVVGRVLIDDQSAAEHTLRDMGFDLWNHWTELDQVEQFGLTAVEGAPDEEHGVSYLQIDVPVPTDRLPSQATDEFVVSEPVTVSIP